VFGAGRCEIVERPVRHADDVSRDEGRAFSGRNFRVFEAIFPLIDRPAAEIILGKLREDLLEVDLAIAERAISGGAVQPRLISGIEACFPVGRNSASFT
jgi:hypothetical protein